jgi:hypothetical protein
MWALSPRRTVDSTGGSIQACLWLEWGSAKATDALLTLHYENGTKTYEMRQTLQPAGQMWANFADLIHHREADGKGNVLPADLNNFTAPWTLYSDALYDERQPKARHSSRANPPLVILSEASPNAPIFNTLGSRSEGPMYFAASATTLWPATLHRPKPAAGNSPRALEPADSTP